MQEYLLSKKTIMLWRLRLFAVCVPVFAAGIALCLVSFYFLVLSAAAAVFCAVFGFWYLPQFQKSYKITVTSEYLCVKRGVIIKTESVMPSPRLISARLFCTPISLILGLCSIQLSAARGRVSIAAIEQDTARQLLKLLEGEYQDEKAQTSSSYDT